MSHSGHRAGSSGGETIQEPRLQNGPVRPCAAKISSAVDASGGFQPSSIRPAYQSLDSSYIVCAFVRYPRWWPVSFSHASSSASDRKPWMFAHVNPMSAQNSAAGTSM